MEQEKQLLSIVGASSFLGQELLKKFEGRQGLALHGTYRGQNPRPDGFIALDRLDVTSEIDLERYAERILSLHVERPLTVLYCCGHWSYGPLVEMDDHSLHQTIAVGLVSPILLTQKLLKLGLAKRPVKIILVGGLGGHGIGIPFNSVYSAAMTGLKNFIASTGAEIAGSGSSCIGLSIGLFDKGQPYIGELCENLNIRYPVPVHDLMSLIERLVFDPGTSLNGSILQVSGGLQHYGETVKFLMQRTRQQHV